MKRTVLVVAVTLVITAMLASTALAQEPSSDPNCTFANGKTTCTETVPVGSVFVRSEHVGYIYVDCGGSSLRLLPLYEDYFADVYETRTTVYKGKSHKVLSMETAQSQGEPYTAGTWWPSC